MNKLTQKNGDRGSVLLITMMFMFVLAVFTTIFLFSVDTAIRKADYVSNSTKAIYLAEAGLNKAIYYVLGTAPDGTTDGSWRTTAYPAAAGPNPTDPRNESFSGGSYTMWVETSGSDILITASGIYNGLTRTVHQKVTLVVGVPLSLTVVAGSWGEG